MTKERQMQGKGKREKRKGGIEEREREGERERDRQIEIDRQIERQTEIDKQIDRERQIKRERERERGRETLIKNVNKEKEDQLYNFAFVCSACHCVHV